MVEDSYTNQKILNNTKKMFFFQKLIATVPTDVETLSTLMYIHAEILNSLRTPRFFYLLIPSMS